MVRFAEKTLRRVDREQFLRTGKPNVKEQVDDTGERVKYMESYLAKDKKYIPYEKQQEYKEFQQKKAEKQREKAEDSQPLLVVLCIIGVGAIAFLWATGVFG